MTIHPKKDPVSSMRITLSLIAGLMVSAPLQAAPARPSATVTRTDDGYLMGSPSAPIRLVVLSAYGCPHCRVLDRTMTPPLKRDWIDTGKVSLRYVPFGMFPTDIPSIMLAECGSTSGFFERSGRVFEMQGKATSQYAGISESAKTDVAASKPGDVPRGLALLSGLDRMSASAGVAKAAYLQCLQDPSRRKALSTRQKLISARYRFEGTPAVWINGRQTGTGSSWTKLEAALRAATR